MVRLAVVRSARLLFEEKAGTCMNASRIGRCVAWAHHPRLLLNAINTWVGTRLRVCSTSSRVISDIQCFVAPHIKPWVSRRFVCAARADLMLITCLGLPAHKCRDDQEDPYLLAVLRDESPDFGITQAELIAFCLQ